MRAVTDDAVTVLAILATVIVIAPLVAIFAYLLYKGASSLNLAFFTQIPKPVGETGGGMANAIVGSGVLLAVASAIGVPIGIGGGIFLAEFGRGTKFANAIRFTADVLNGVPSIVMGMAIYVLIVKPNDSIIPFSGHFSAFSGGVALGIMMIPITVRSTEEFLLGVPRNLREGAMALGASKWKTIVTVIVPAAYRGILTGILLAFARVAGETAPLLFTALGNSFWSQGFSHPTASLPVVIWNYAISAYDDWHRQAWAAGLVLLALILVINIVARAIMARGISAPR